MYQRLSVIALVVAGTWLLVGAWLPSRTPLVGPAFASEPPVPPALGAYVAGAPQDTGPLHEFEAMTGHRPAIVHWYQPWGYTKGPYQPVLDRAALEAVAARGATPMITWEAWGPRNGVEPSRLRDIPTGAFDDYIDSWAHELRAFRAPVYLRLFHEMNNSRYPWAYGQNGNSAQDLIAAWRHVHGRFARAGAANVHWVWSPNTENDLVSFSTIYPGDAYVDWFGVDGYNGGRELDRDGWRSPSDVFSRSFDAFRTLSPTKPVMIAETSTMEEGGSKAQWINALYTDLPAAFPTLRAIVWFHADFRSKGEADWRINTSDAALEAFRTVVGPRVH
jgi:glycosyl hydrolase family 26